VTSDSGFAGVPRVLVVDDDAMICRELARRVREAAAEAVEACSAFDAVEMLRSQAFTLVFTDYRLGDGDGLMVAREARSLGVPVVVISSAPRDVPREEAREAGVLEGVDKHILWPDRILDWLRHVTPEN